MAKRQQIQTLFTRPDGSVEGLNTRRLWETPFFLLPNVQDNTSSGVTIINNINVDALESVGPVPMTVSKEGPLYVTAFAAGIMVQDTVTPTSVDIRVMLQIQDGDQVYSLMNAPVKLTTIVGSYGDAGGTNPSPIFCRLPEALYLKAGRSLLITVFNTDDEVDVTVKFVALCQRFQQLQVEPDIEDARKEAQERLLTMPYWYTFDRGSPLAFNGSANLMISLSQTHHFILWQLAAENSAGVSSVFDLNIIESLTGEGIIDYPPTDPLTGNTLGAALSSGLICGNGQFNFRFQEGRFFSAGSELRIPLLTTASVVTHLTLGGSAVSKQMWR